MTFPIAPPIDPMLARLEEEIPTGDGWRYEPKWDGFRAIVFRDGDTVQIDSRNRLRLDRYFPEIVETLKGAIPERCVLDGELVIETDHGLDFELLQLRLHPAASRVNKLSKEIPASFVAFDLLASGNDDLRSAGLDQRRARLLDEVIVGDTCMVTPQTTDSTTASDWFERFEGAGCDGIIAKQHDLVYTAGKRTMVKVKHKRTADVVVGGYRLSKDGKGLGSLLLGIYDENGSLQHVGFTASLSAARKKEILEILKPIEGDSGFGEHQGPGGASRWSGPEERAWVSLKPVLVAEVAFDYLQGHRFRHGARLVRWRPDKQPTDCTYDQFVRPEPFALSDIRALGDTR